MHEERGAMFGCAWGRGVGEGVQGMVRVVRVVCVLWLGGGGLDTRYEGERWVWCFDGYVDRLLRPEIHVSDQSNHGIPKFCKIK